MREGGFEPQADPPAEFAKIFRADIKRYAEIVKAAKIDGASMARTYASVILPLLRPAFLTVFIIMVALAIRTFDLMVAMTGGGPGFATDLPTNFMFQFAFGRQRLGLAAASSIMIFVAVAMIMAPLIWSELRRERLFER